jgi:molecular chaperone GrpE
MHDENPPQTQQPTSPGRTTRDDAPAAGDDTAFTPNEPANASPERANASDPNAQLQSALAESAQAREALLRALADLENMRKRTATELANAHKYAIEAFASNLLAVKDTLEMALGDKTSTLEQLRMGVDLTLKNLASAFEKARIADIDPLNQKFDPSLHQAVTQVDSDRPANTVVQVFQKGYTLGDRVLRPAMVAVSKGPASQLRPSENPVESEGN